MQDKNQTQYEYTSNPNNGTSPTSLSGLVRNFKENFLRNDIEIVPGLKFNQYETVKRIYYYIHNQFESGPNDENGDPKYFYDLVTDRNDEATKNINLNTKDCYIKAESEGAYLKSWLLRREFMAYAKTSGFGMKLNQIAMDLPAFGTVLWKKCKNADGDTDVHPVDLINIMNDPSVECLKDGLIIERHFMTQTDMRGYAVWNQNVVNDLINSGGATPRVAFLDTNTALQSAPFQTRIDTTTPFYEIYELWGEIPRWMYEQYQTGGKNRAALALPEVRSSGAISQPVTPSAKYNETVFCMAIVAGVESGKTERILFCKEVDPDNLPYKEVHYRRRKGRWLGVGNYEACFQETEKANELTNRFFASLRIALLHLYQTRDKLHVKNVLTDLLDGDVVVSKSELTAIPTEIRGFSQYKEEIDRIENKCDKICKSFEIITGENLPSNTPFKLGSQQLASATKFFGFVQENMGLFLEDVFNKWLLPGFSASLTDEHILDILDDMDDIEIYYTAKRKLYQYDVMKRYILAHNQMPSPEDLQLIGQLVQDQISKGPKQVKVESNYYADLTYSIKMVITGENDTKKENLETLSEIYQVTAANPAALQDPRLLKILNLILEETGFSPLEINTINQTPTNPTLNPANQGGGGADNFAAAARGAPSQTGAPVVPGRQKGAPVGAGSGNYK